MKLFMVGGSPYSRLVRVIAAERGLSERIEIVTANPHERPPELVAANPLSKVPTLVADDGFAHVDSFAICLFLDSIGTAPPLVPIDRPDRWAVLQRRIFANGIMDCAVARRVESWKAPEPDRLDWMERQLKTIRRTLDRFEQTIGSFGDGIGIDALTLACALGYLDFRFAGDNWRDGRPCLAAWYEGIARRPSMRATEYFD